jgi:kynureninase
LDERDPLAPFREEFALPPATLYLDGNSLGVLPKATGPRLAQLVAQEWGVDLIRSWNAHHWIDAPTRVGARIAGLVGARPNEVVVADSTSVNLFKLLAGAVGMRPDRRVILTETGNFPTDLYMMQGLARLLGDRLEIKTASADQLPSLIDETVIAVALTHVHYKSGRRWPMAEITALAHAEGALTIWDLSHSAGALAVDLNGAGADFAVGCGYKYLNGGPGAPAFLFVAERHQHVIASPLTGWMGHAEPFAFTDAFAPAPDMRRQLCGTPPILGLAALEVGVEIATRAPMAKVEAKSAALCDLFIETVEAGGAAGFGLTLASPRLASERGSHISFTHPEAYGLVQALIARGVVGDFRAPDIARFGFTPLYLTHSDVVAAAEELLAVLREGAHTDPRHQIRLAVT